MGENGWRDEQEWPLAPAAETALLPPQRRPRQHAATATAPQRRRARRASRPTSSSTTRATRCRRAAGSCAARSCCTPGGAFDQRAGRGARRTCSSTRTPPLERGARGDRAGRRSRSGPRPQRADTDFTAKLVDVAPGRLRPQPDRRHHPRPLPPAARRAAAPITPARDYEYTIDLWATSNVFLRRPPHPAGGHQQQLPALRPQPQHRPPRRRATPSSGPRADRLPRRATTRRTSCCRSSRAESLTARSGGLDASPVGVGAVAPVEVWGLPEAELLRAPASLVEFDAQAGAFGHEGSRRRRARVGGERTRGHRSRAASVGGAAPRARRSSAPRRPGGSSRRCRPGREGCAASGRGSAPRSSRRPSSPR